MHPKNPVSVIEGEQPYPALRLRQRPYTPHPVFLQDLFTSSSSLALNFTSEAGAYSTIGNC
ncbi:MAG: hypothetical protein SAL70_02900 [Scytonema sp. PMC 1070.18]|nr:hypothetical protein [Scytonema sp. PMC 1070.18]